MSISVPEDSVLPNTLTVQTLMKCSFRLHFIWIIFTVCQRVTTCLGSFQYTKAFKGFMLSLAEVNNQCFVLIRLHTSLKVNEDVYKLQCLMSLRAVTVYS